MYTVDKAKLTEEDVCVNCGKDLRLVKEIHVTEGRFYCSEQCSIDYHTNEIIANAKEQAKAIYNDFTEVVTPIDIGVVEEKIYTAYSAEADITFIMKDIVTASDNSNVSTEVVGFYYGKPDEKSTQAYIGDLKAIFI